MVDSTVQTTIPTSYTKDTTIKAQMANGKQINIINRGKILIGEKRTNCIELLTGGKKLT